MELLVLLGSAIWFILPAYVANGAPVVFGGGRPIDGGRKFTDGRPIFGPGKTVRGFAAGLVAGSAFGLIQGIIVGQIYTLAVAGILFSVGALVGDLLGSFIKRRLNISRGAAAPGLDQLGFLIIAMAFASPVVLPTVEIFITLLIITPAIHLATNYGGYKLGFKDRPY